MVSVQTLHASCPVSKSAWRAGEGAGRQQCSGVWLLASQGSPSICYWWAPEDRRTDYDCHCLAGLSMTLGKDWVVLFKSTVPVLKTMYRSLLLAGCAKPQTSVQPVFVYLYSCVFPSAEAASISVAKKGQTVVAEDRRNGDYERIRKALFFFH